jgi:hypothetical protein
MVDGTRMYLGSADWTGAGLGAKGEDRRNLELGVVTQDEAWLDEAQALHDNLWHGAACKACELRDECEALRA